MRTKYDAILVLGKGFEPKNFLPRLKIAYKFYKSGLARKIILSGNFWGGRKRKPKMSEARAMALYLQKWGASKKDVLIEDKSLNTIGNLYFTKKFFLYPRRLQRIMIITSKDHLPKAKFLAKRILAKKYKYQFIDDHTSDRYFVKKGHFGVADMRVLYEGSKDGVDKITAGILANDPLYAHHYGPRLPKILK